MASSTEQEILRLTAELLQAVALSDYDTYVRLNVSGAVGVFKTGWRAPPREVAEREDSCDAWFVARARGGRAVALGESVAVLWRGRAGGRKGGRLTSYRL